MSEYPNAIDYWIDRSRVFQNQNSHRAIVLHGTGGNPAQTAQQLGDYFRTNASMVCTHFGIDRDGVVAQYCSLNDGACGNCCLEPGYDPFWDQFGGDNLNRHTISIEHVNDVSNSLPLTDAQKQASFALVKWLCDKYGLTADQVKTHQSIAPSSRARCPGAAFPLNELVAFLQGGNTMIPNGWKDDGSTLTAPNGHKVVLGFRDYILKNGWDPGNLPLEEEYHADPVEDYYDQPGANSGTRQLFLYAELIYTPQRGVYIPGIGMELLGARRERDALRKQVQGQALPPQIVSAITTVEQAVAVLKQVEDSLPKA